MESFIGCALPLYLCDGADRHYENYIIRRDSIFYAIDFSYLFGRKPKSATDCYGIGTTRDLKNYFPQHNMWDELLLSALKKLRKLNEISADVCKMAEFYFGDLFHEISVLDVVKERLSNEVAWNELKTSNQGYDVPLR